MTLGLKRSSWSLSNPLWCSLTLILVVELSLFSLFLLFLCVSHLLGLRCVLVFSRSPVSILRHSLINSLSVKPQSRYLIFESSAPNQYFSYRSRMVQLQLYLWIFSQLLWFSFRKICWNMQRFFRVEDEEELRSCSDGGSVGTGFAQLNLGDYFISRVCSELRRVGDSFIFDTRLYIPVLLGCSWYSLLLMWSRCFRLLGRPFLRELDLSMMGVFSWSGSSMVGLSLKVGMRMRSLPDGQLVYLLVIFSDFSRCRVLSCGLTRLFFLMEPTLEIEWEYWVVLMGFLEGLSSIVVIVWEVGSVKEDSGGIGVDCCLKVSNSLLWDGGGASVGLFFARLWSLSLGKGQGVKGYSRGRFGYWCQEFGLLLRSLVMGLVGGGQFDLYFAFYWICVQLDWEVSERSRYGCALIFQLSHFQFLLNLQFCSVSDLLLMVICALLSSSPLPLILAVFSRSLFLFFWEGVASGDPPSLLRLISSKSMIIAYCSYFC